MITLLLLYYLLSAQVRKAGYHRWDGSPALPYYTASACGMEEETFSFFSGKWKLFGSRYFLKGVSPKALVIFFPGIGAGRNAYLKLMSEFVHQGYWVYAFDYTGCMQSQGPYANGLGQVVFDQAAFFAWLDQDSKSQGLVRYAVGHSWGGYAAMVACKTPYKIAKCVSLSGFCRPSEEMRALAKPLQNPLFYALVKLFISNHGGKEANLDAVDVLNQSGTPIFYAQGLRDNVVPPAVGSTCLKRGLKRPQQARYLLVEGRGHQVFLTNPSEKYLNDLNDQKISSSKGPIGLSMDIAQASVDDSLVLKAIFDFLSE